MNHVHDLLIDALDEKRPLVLILGQDAWRESGSDDDSVLARALDHLKREDGAIEGGWRQLLGAEPLPQGFYDWLADRFASHVAPDWLFALGEIPWSAVFTSSLDPTAANLFSKRQRPETVLTNAETPPAVRSRVRPPLYYLFGNAASALDPRARPPSDRNQLNIRRVNDALPLLARTLDTATRLGLVLIDGVAPRRDWLNLDDILGALGNAGENQIIWFNGRTSPLPDEEGFLAAVEAGRVLVVEERLCTVIAELLAVGRIEDLIEPESDEAGRTTFKNGKSLETSPEERLNVEAVATIVDDAWTTPLTPLGEEAEYAAFRRFHGEPGNARSLVEGVRRKFAIERDYEAELQELVHDAIEKHAKLKAPIILHGQSATGKSIALARVVAKVREGKEAAVLYSTNRVPQPSDIADFCHNAEEAGADVTLIVCDANEDVGPYNDLFEGLRSKGLRIVVLGSRYRLIDDDRRKSRSAVEASPDLSDGERGCLAALLEQFTDDGHVGPQGLRDNHMLALLYRALPPSRSRIAARLSEEASHTEREVRDQRAAYKAARPPQTLMAQRLREAGAEDIYQLFDVQQRRVLDAGNVAGRIIDLVMVAGSLSCPVPFNLLLRLASDEQPAGLTDVAELYGGLDLFRWRWDEEDNELFVMPRLPLEADLICRRRLGGPQNEAECIIALVGAVRSIGDAHADERRFLFDILRRAGPGGPRRNRYKSAYVEMARTLTSLRTHFGVLHPGIVLQESVFRRHAIREGTVEDDHKMDLLAEARDAVQMAIDGMASGSISSPRKTRRSLNVELATLYGFIANHKAATQRPNAEVWHAYVATRSTVLQAASATDYHPLDVGLWTPSDLLENGDLEDWQRAELAADMYGILDQINPRDLASDQQQKFHERSLKTGYVLEDEPLYEAAYESLMERGSTAGIYLRARRMAPQRRVDHSKPYSNADHAKGFSNRERAEAREAADFLEGHMNLIAGDARCLSLLLDCQWIAEMGQRPFAGQREPLPSTDDSTRGFLDIVMKLNHASGEAPRNVTRYLAAVLTWRIGSESSARQMFQDLGRDSDYEDPSRVVQRHVITDENRSPVRFDGRVEQESKSGKHWIVRLEGEHRQTVRLLSRDFPNANLAYGRRVRDFSVAFNFIGPIATPIR